MESGKLSTQGGDTCRGETERTMIILIVTDEQATYSLYIQKQKLFKVYQSKITTLW